MSRKTGKKGFQKKPMDLTQRVLTIFRTSSRKPFNHKQLATRLYLHSQEDRHRLDLTLKVLLQKNEIEELDRGKYRMKSQEGYITGVVDLNSSGTAYIISRESEDDIFIAQPNQKNALHGDTVKVYLFPNKNGRKPEGEIVEIIQEGKREFVGIVELNKKYAFITIESRNMPYDIFVPIEDINGAQDGQKVVVRITDFPRKAKNPTGEIIEVLGNVGDNNTEMHAILAEFDLPYRFSDEVEEFAKTVPEDIPESEIKKRRDFRKTTTFTIDPVDAKDFDDALSIEFLEDGNFEIGVHIADVTHYVKLNTKLEEEAQHRATSVYLVDRVVPMLPEKLSNKVCSLRPNEEKLTFSAVFKMDTEGKILSEWFGRTIINSDRRFTYEEAQAVIETGEGDLVKEILTMDTLAKKMREKRFSSGAIAFDKKEVKFQIDENGKPLGVFYKESKDSNKLIEEFMLLANKKVAEFAGKIEKKTFVYRVHDKPDEFKLNDFGNFIKKFGYKLNTSGGEATAKSLNKLLVEIHDKKERNVFEQLAVRAMAKAVYTTENIGHYGLAFSHYSHFTSPIRRYPDMMVHRLLDRYLEKGSSASQDEYEEMCKHSSAREILASNAERASIKYKQVEWMKDHLGEVFEGVVSGVTEWGMYVELKETLCEGMVPMRDIDDDHYIFDDKNYCLRGKSKGKVFTFGDDVIVKIVRADLVKRQLDFILATPEELAEQNNE